MLDMFHEAYPGIRETFYTGMVQEVVLTGFIKSKAIHYHNNVDNYEHRFPDSLSWVRRCFGNPKKVKHILNSYIANCPQGLNAQTLNKAWWRIFMDIAIQPKHCDHFKLCAQIHDSILFQYRDGHEYLCHMVRERMEIPVTIKGYDGVIRTFTVPASIKAGTNGKKAKYWSETE